MPVPTPRWKRRPEGSNWGDFGADDELGRLNLLTPEKVRQGVAEVIEGRSFCLSLPLDHPRSQINPRRAPPRLRPLVRFGLPNMNYPLSRDRPGATDVVCDDEVTLALQFSTHWDSFAHVGQCFDVDGNDRPRNVYYNGFRAGESVLGTRAYQDDETIAEAGDSGALRLSVASMAAACIQGRGVMIDVAAHFGRSGRIIGFPEWSRILELDRVIVEPGDIVCIRTGFAQGLLDMGSTAGSEQLTSTTSALDGRDESLRQWITDSGVAAIVADNYAVETLPARPGATACCSGLPLHEHCLFKLGIPLGELWHLGELADWLRANGRSRFLLTAPPLRLPRAVGSPATPIATV